MLVQLNLSFIIPAALSLVLTPFVIRLAARIGAIDRPNERKVHLHPIPRLGGVGICVSFFLSLFLIHEFDASDFTSTWMTSHQGIMLMVSLLVVFALGIWDDLKSLSPGQKFIVQIIAASLAYFAGFRISTVTHPLGAEPLVLGILDYPVTILWIVGVSNAFNLIDGLDGLATGVALIASLTIGAIAYLNNDMSTVFPVLILAGALFGFLRYNFNPARIFLGDSGSLFIGFALATLSIQSSTKGSTAFAILVPVLSLGLPIMDTLVAMIRRFLGSLLPDKPDTGSLVRKLRIMFLPDRKHVHHQLLALGLSHRTAVLILYSVSCLFGLGAFAVTMSNNAEASVILVAVALAIFAGIRQLHYNEMAILRNGILLPLYATPTINRNIFLALVDLGFCALAFIASYYLTFHTLGHDQFNKILFPYLAVVCGVQMALFSITGLYRNTFQYLGIADLLSIVKTVFAAVTATGIVLIVLPVPKTLEGLPLFVTDFYLLLTLIAGSRSSFHILNFLFHREPRGEKNLIIYGADAHGVLALQQLLQDKNPEFTLVGFLDDAPHMEGKRVNGYPVFGGHWKLPQVARKHKIDQILISNGSIQIEALNRLMDCARKNGIAVRRSRVLLEDIQPAFPARANLQPAPVVATENGPDLSVSA